MGEEAEKFGRYGMYLRIGVLWLALTAILCAAIIAFDLARAQARFQEQGNDLFDYVSNRIETSTTVLDGFTALLASSDDPRHEKDRVSFYAEQMLRRYPFIYMLEIAMQVPRHQLEGFVAEQRQAGSTDFRVRAFDFVTRRTWVPLADSPYYYPIVFMRPQPQESQEILGLDIGSNEFFRRALAASERLRQPVASHPFVLIEGERAYMMHSAVLHTNGNSGLRYGLLVIKAASLLPADIRRTGRSLRLHHVDFAPGDQQGLLAERAGESAGMVESWLFPRFTYTRTLDDPGQPFVLQVEQQLEWSDLNRPLLGLALLGSMLSFMLLLGYARIHHQHELQRLVEADRLFQLANYDSLTGLPNRNLLQDRLHHAQQRAYRQEMTLALLFIDLDKFKMINDTFGHEGGDALLCMAARRLQECVRESDTLGRLGGDEFVAVLEDCKPEEPARVVRKIEEAFTRSFRLQDTEVHLQASVGIATYPDDGTDVRQLLRFADDEMYARKLRQRSAG
jgi:diguanylate cyclase (GGDEF)-like protein